MSCEVIEWEIDSIIDENSPGCDFNIIKPFMNIFKLDNDPIVCAKYHCDKHVVKMILEYAQIISTAHRVLNNNNNEGLHKATHI